MTTRTTTAAAALTLALTLSPAVAVGEASASSRAAPAHALEAAGHVHHHLAERMASADPALRLRLARTIVEEAALARVDPMLVLAVIHVESSFRPDVTSHAGAIGLMQLLEPTLRQELARAGMEAADPRDPEVSVRGGVRYLRRLLDIFGELDVALMAYNAGPNRILGYLRAGGIPERFHEYPRRVRNELAKLRAPPQRRPIVVADAS